MRMKIRIKMTKSNNNNLMMFNSIIKIKKKMKINNQV